MNPGEHQFIISSGSQNGVYKRCISESFYDLPTFEVALQWRAADAENKVSSGENTELKRSPLKPGVGQCSHTCSTY